MAFQKLHVSYKWLYWSLLGSVQLFDKVLQDDFVLRPSWTRMLMADVITKNERMRSKRFQRLLEWLSHKSYGNVNLHKTEGGAMVVKQEGKSPTPHSQPPTVSGGSWCACLSVGQDNGQHRCMGNNISMINLRGALLPHCRSVFRGCKPCGPWRGVTWPSQPAGHSWPLPSRRTGESPHPLPSFLLSLEWEYQIWSHCMWVLASRLEPSFASASFDVAHKMAYSITFSRPMSG